MCTREFGAQPFTGLQLMRLDHRPAVTPAPPGKPHQGAFILVDDNFATAGHSDDLALPKNEMLRAKAVDFGLLRIRSGLFDLVFLAHVRTPNPGSPRMRSKSSPARASS